MYTANAFVALLATASTAQAFQLSDLKSTASDAARSVGDAASSMLTRKSSSCPKVWSDISTTLTGQFLSNGQCNDDAHAAIRSSFHDCFNGACDGSLILANECANSENDGLSSICSTLGSLAKSNKVGYADMIQFAAAHAIKTCPGGPTVPVKVGRKDSSKANALGVLPAGNAQASDLIQLFASKGFSTTDLTALIGAHTAARQQFADPSKAGASLDTTPGEWDNQYYQDTIDGKAPFTLESDKNLQTDSQTSGDFSNFASSQSAWASAFVPAMTKMSMLGVDDSGLVDCTSALPGGSSKRDVKKAPLFERMTKW
ncbi:class II peroxidase [Pleomassaria siparia CBS 279.74]|uniref:Peroxidase n=1 Tax=Pleomassaria siparia CBS 279.74 TaxID=1314801 RepID=A0A6G1KD67_9PLEO|nr:class II peroxidase [Pleomassaria siparia CBS 279.74]